MTTVTNAPRRECIVCGSDDAPMALAHIYDDADDAAVVCQGCLPHDIDVESAPVRELVLAVANYADASELDEWNGDVARIGRAVVTREGTDQPFSLCDLYPSERAADDAYWALHDSGCGATEWDIYIGWHAGRYTIALPDGETQHCETLRRAIATARLYMMRTGDCPAVWHTEGNYCYLRMVDVYDPDTRGTGEANGKD